MSDETDNECLNYIRLYQSEESGDHLSEADHNRMSGHVSSCASCTAWQKQNEAMISLASAMPQFDVSEGLTQKILGSIEKESTPGMEVSPVPIAIAAGFLFLLLVPFDSVQSLYSWGVGVLGLFVLHLLMKAASSQEQVI